MKETKVNSPFRTNNSAYHVCIANINQIEWYSPETKKIISINFTAEIYFRIIFRDFIRVFPFYYLSYNSPILKTTVAGSVR